MLDGIGKDIGLTSAVLPRILLTSKDNGLCTIDLVDAVDDSVKTLHLLELLGIEVEEIALDGTVGPNTHDNHSCLLVLIALAEHLLQDFRGRLYDLDSAARGYSQTLLLEVPVLRQVLAEEIGLQEYADDAGHAALLPKFLRTSGCIVGNMGAHCLKVAYHSGEAPAGADAFLFRHFLIGYGVDTIQLLPRPQYDNIPERGTYPCLVLHGEIIGDLHTIGNELGGILPAYAPYFFYGIEFQSLHALLFGINDTAMSIADVFLCKMRGHLGQGFRGRKSDADGHPDPLPDLLMQLFAPGLIIYSIETLPIDKAFVYGVSEIGRGFLFDYGNNPASKFSI